MASSSSSIGRTIKRCRTIAAFRKTLTPSPILPTTTHHPSSSSSYLRPTAASLDNKSLCSENLGRFNFVPAMVSGLLGLGLVVYAEDASPPPPPEAEAKPPSTHVDMEAIAKKERLRLEDLLKTKGMQYGSYPRFTVAVKGQKVTIKFQIPPTCEIALLISNIVANLGVKVDERATGSDMTLRAWDSGVAWQLTLNRPRVQKEAVQDKGKSDANPNDGDLCILLFRSLISSDKPVSSNLVNLIASLFLLYMLYCG